MNRLKSSLGFFVAALLVGSIFVQPVMAAAAFFYGVSSSSFALAIDYEGNGTVSHMNGTFSTLHEGRTSLQELNIVESSDMRIRVFGVPLGTLSVGRPDNAVGFSYTLREFFFTPPEFVAISTDANSTVFGLSASAAQSLQSAIDLYGPDNLFLALRINWGGNSQGGSVRVFSARQEIDVDIKPDADPNSINPNSRGVIAVAVLTTASFDASTVDVDSVSFGVSGNGDAPLRSALRDVDGDGDDDLILHFKPQGTGIECGTSALYLKADTLSGQPIGGLDGVLTVGCR